MTDALARVMFAATVVLLVPVLAFLYITSRPSETRGNAVVAQFEDAFPLVEGMNVRVGGAVAGSVGTIEVDDDGLAEVSLRLDDDVEAPRADATAAIRQQDSTGDSYVAFEPGEARAPLREVDGRPTIVCGAKRPDDSCARTLVAPRLDDLLNAFGKSERAGIQLTLSELARAVDQRGTDLNRAALDLRPGLAAANQALAEVNSQNAALRSFIGDAEAVTGQAASRTRSLQKALDGLEGTLRATTAETRSLDAGLEKLPATAQRARTTLAAVRSAADEGRPLAEDLRTTAPLLATAVGRAPGFLGDLKAFLTRTKPTLERTHDLITASAPAIEAEPSRVVTGPFDLAPAISNMLRGVLGEDETIEVLFNKNFGFGAVSREPGNQAGYPASWADRHMMRVSAVLNCEGFGVQVKPGCLLDLLKQARARDGDLLTKRKRRAERTEKAPERTEAPAQEQAPSQQSQPSTPSTPALPQLPKAPAPIQKILDALPLPGRGSAGNPQPPTPSTPQPPAPPSDDTDTSLLDFLLK